MGRALLVCRLAVRDLRPVRPRQCCCSLSSLPRPRSPWVSRCAGHRPALSAHPRGDRRARRGGPVHLSRRRAGERRAGQRRSLDQCSGQAA